MGNLGKILLTASLIVAGITLNIISCAVYDAWALVVVVIIYFLAAVPNMLFGEDSSSNPVFGAADSGWEDVGRFLTAAVCSSGFAFPLVLYHADVVDIEPMLLSLLGGFLVYGSLLFYVKAFHSTNDAF
eukprot:GCRY01001367.1.p2 GENE.GCRY01001367.1~~GCRY01001367.1.p2  ORF type:complete len:129 (-),score=17.68 GCRY01001367.1:159-545(-)